MKLRLIAAAKINWTLEALGRRDDGYHEIRTVFQTIALHDTVVLSSAETLELRLAGAASSPDWQPKDDLAYRAAQALREETGDPSLGALIELEKVVPPAAGLGGGSSDAAAVLRGLNRLWRLDFDRARLARIAASLGSDVAFFLTGGTAIAGGRGDEVAPMPDVPTMSLLIAVPRDRLPQKTALMYRRLRPEHYTSGERTGLLVDKLKSGAAVSDDDVFNVFDAVLFESMPVAAVLAEECAEGGACPHLAGSGPALFFLSPPREDVRERLLRAGVELFETTTLTAAGSTAWEEL
ncbi:MAG: 4-(cytidine 5'-diphospho)-2-C-methyl-D-erythritol kinase [Dehalococcoidia bacterium]|jgi:4-diphosphocytidyl-2-C-methyl-D-erythritol kinase